jgi:hypothetical protein
VAVVINQVIHRPIYASCKSLASWPMGIKFIVRTPYSVSSFCWSNILPLFILCEPCLLLLLRLAWVNVETHARHVKGTTEGTFLCASVRVCECVCVCVCHGVMSILLVSYDLAQLVAGDWRGSKNKEPAQCPGCNSVHLCTGCGSVYFFCGSVISSLSIIEYVCCCCYIDIKHSRRTRTPTKIQRWCADATSRTSCMSRSTSVCVCATE